MEQLTQEKLKAVEAIPIPKTRAEKLERWAKLIDAHPHSLLIFHRLEYHREQWGQIADKASAFSVAFGDPALREAGLKGETVLHGQQFFELTSEDIHAFSCDCGGGISNKDMASRIRKIAGGSGRSVGGVVLRIITPLMAPMLPTVAAAAAAAAIIALV